MYILSLAAVKEGDDKQTVFHVPQMANRPRDMRELSPSCWATMQARIEFPPSEGWTKHSAQYVKVPWWMHLLGLFGL